MEKIETSPDASKLNESKDTLELGIAEQIRIFREKKKAANEGNSFARHQSAIREANIFNDVGLANEIVVTHKKISIETANRRWREITGDVSVVEAVTSDTKLQQEVLLGGSINSKTVDKNNTVEQKYLPDESMRNSADDVIRRFQIRNRDALRVGITPGVAVQKKETKEGEVAIQDQQPKRSLESSNEHLAMRLKETEALVKSLEAKLDALTKKHAEPKASTKLDLELTDEDMIGNTRVDIGLRSEEEMLQGYLATSVYNPENFLSKTTPEFKEKVLYLKNNPEMRLDGILEIVNDSRESVERAERLFAERKRAAQESLKKRGVEPGWLLRRLNEFKAIDPMLKVALGAALAAGVFVTGGLPYIMGAGLLSTFVGTSKIYDTILKAEEKKAQRAGKEVNKNAIAGRSFLYGAVVGGLTGFELTTMAEFLGMRGDISH